MSLQIGQKIHVDLFGISVGGVGAADAPAEGMVVGLAPGVITVQLERDDGAVLEVTVSPGRIAR